jgi:heme exporter protein A
VLTPTAGEVHITVDGKSIAQADVYACIGFVAPYFQLYEEFTAWENLDIARKLRCLSIPDDRIDVLIERVNLTARKHDVVRTYSSGMKQRLKYAHALLHSPAILLLDEPTSNLDTDGIEIVHQLIQEQKKNGVVIVATNVKEELSLCENILDLDAVQLPGKVTS